MIQTCSHGKWRAPSLRYNAGLKREIDAIIAAELHKVKDKPRPPSLFMSLSCAEFCWRTMLEYLSKHVAAVEGTEPWSESTVLVRGRGFTS